MKRFLCAALIVVLTLMSGTAALAAARMPEYRGVVTDDADVLSAEMVQDIQAYAEMAEDDTDVNIHVAIVHFLDGLDAKTYAEQLFEKWDLDHKDILLLGAAGEDSFATVLGEKVARQLGQTNADNLMYTSSSFGELFARQQYDAAFASWFTALNTLLNKQYDENMKLGKLFASAQVMPADDNGDAQSISGLVSQLWTQTLDSIDGSTADYQQYHEERQHQDNGIGVGGWIVLLIIIAIVFGQSDPVRKARNAGRSHYRDYGCGCSPLGWILTMIGFNAIIDSLRGGRRRR